MSGVAGYSFSRDHWVSGVALFGSQFTILNLLVSATFKYLCVSDVGGFKGNGFFVIMHGSVIGPLNLPRK